MTESRRWPTRTATRTRSGSTSSACWGSTRTTSSTCATRRRRRWRPRSATSATTRAGCGRISTRRAARTWWCTTPGHGVPGLRDRKGYLLPSDANPDTAQLNGYPIDLLYENLGRMTEAASIRVFLDACFSGDSQAGMLIRSASPMFVSASLPDLSGKAMAVLTAASGDEVASWDERAEHGMFTHHLLDALYGSGDADGDGRVTVAETKRYLDRHLTRAARRAYLRDQTAGVGGDRTMVLASAPGGSFPTRPEVGRPPPPAQPFTVQTDPGGRAGADSEHSGALRAGDGAAGGRIPCGSEFGGPRDHRGDGQTTARRVRRSTRLRCGVRRSRSRSVTEPGGARVRFLRHRGPLPAGDGAAGGRIPCGSEPGGLRDHCGDRSPRLGRCDGAPDRAAAGGAAVYRLD